MYERRNTEVAQEVVEVMGTRGDFVLRGARGKIGSGLVEPEEQSTVVCHTPANFSAIDLFDGLLLRV